MSFFSYYDCLFLARECFHRFALLFVLFFSIRMKEFKHNDIWQRICYCLVLLDRNIYDREREFSISKILRRMKFIWSIYSEKAFRLFLHPIIQFVYYVFTCRLNLPIIRLSIYYFSIGCLISVLQSMRDVKV